MQTFAHLHRIEDSDRREAIREDLLVYCHLDTLAMVRIWERLGEMVGQYLLFIRNDTFWYKHFCSFKNSQRSLFGVCFLHLLFLLVVISDNALILSISRIIIRISTAMPPYTSATSPRTPLVTPLVQ